MPPKLIVEVREQGQAEFRVCRDVLVPPMPVDEALRLIKANIHKDIALYKKEALFSLITREPFQLHKKWSLGFRGTAWEYQTHLDFIIGYSEKYWGLTHRVFVIPRIHKGQTEGFAEVIRAWLARAEPVKV